MKVLSDFDGVLTDIAEEAHRVREIFTETLIHASGWEAKRIHLLMDRALEHLQKTPHEHGWRTEGRIAAYANEDSFLANIGLSHCLDALSLSENADFLKAVEALKAKNISSFNQVSLNAYQTMTIETKMGKRKPLDAEAVKFLKQLLNAGHQVTIASNSKTDRIVDLLSEHKLPLTVRGEAGKFILDKNRKGFYVGPYWIDTARPNYEKIIRSEKPSVIIGDVFSLDLGLPFYLADTEPEEFGHLQLFLRERPYTPAWVKEFITRGEGKKRVKLLNDFKEFK